MMGSMIVVGCSTIEEAPSPSSSYKEPIIGLWASNDSGQATFYRFHENGTFAAWSHTGDVHPKYSFQYSGQWEPHGPRTYVTEGAHIGYGDVTALAIRRELTLVYDPRHDTFSITVFPDRVFHRLSRDPDSPV
jgi:hypothetical protein